MTNTDEIPKALRNKTLEELPKALKNKNGTCYGCPLKDACKKDNRTANNKCIR